MRTQDYPQDTQKILKDFYQKFPGYQEYLENFLVNNSYYRVLCVSCAREEGLSGAMVSAEQIPCYECGNMPFAISDENNEKTIYTGSHIDFFNYKYHIDAGKNDKNRIITHGISSNPELDFDMPSEYAEAYKKMIKLTEFELKQSEKNLKTNIDRVIEKIPTLISLLNTISYLRDHRDIHEPSDFILEARLQNIIDYLKTSKKKSAFKKHLKKCFVSENV